MAEFSKQWCDLKDPSGLRPDFDIMDISDHLEIGHYLPIICEGFGFTAIGKDVDGSILLAMPTGESDEDENIIVEWKKYDEIIK